MQTEILLQSLINETSNIKSQVEALKKLDKQQLTWKANTESWSVLECLEHLNLYGQYYLPQMKQAILSSKTTASKEFKPGLLGNYFAKSMLPKEKLNKMKTFKDKNPLNAALELTVIDVFLEQQNKLIEIIQLSKNVDINKVKINTSISSFISLKLGDTLQFYINHIIRHLKQIDQIILNFNSTKKI